jgi:hypothetical protein
MHAYYEALASRPDCYAAYSLRSASQVAQYRKGKELDSVYIYPNDPDPRRQDAMKMTIAADAASLRSQVWLPSGHHGDKNLLVTWDIWWGREFDFSNTMIHNYKGVLQFESIVGQIWTSLHASFALAKRAPDTMPQQGPFVAMMWPHTSSPVSVGPNATRGGENSRLPYGFSGTQQRNYSDEALGPRDTSVFPRGAEWGVAAETWTRYWAFFERDPANDWVTNHPNFAGSKMRAYKWTIWASDGNRAPVRIIDGLHVAPHPSQPGGWTNLRFELNVSASQAAKDRIAAGRGPLVAYARNVVVLHGTPKSEVLKLLQRP